MCGGPTKSLLFAPTTATVPLDGYKERFDFKGYPLAMIGGHIVGVVFNDCHWAKFDEKKMRSGGLETIAAFPNPELNVYAYTNEGEFQGRMTLKKLGQVATWDEARVMLSTYWNRQGLCRVYKPKIAA